MRNALASVWDACDVLNLLSTRRAPDILRTFKHPCYVVGKVLEGEVLYLRNLPEESTEAFSKANDVFDDLIDSGLLRVTQLSQEEESLFTKFSEEIDDGEALTLAVAANRGWHVMSDDKPAIRVMESHIPKISYSTTPDWMKFWIDEASVERKAAQDALYRIDRCSQFTPKRSHPLKTWWDDLLNG